jgi:hypothetical protein
LGDLTKSVDTVIASLQTIAKQRPASGSNITAAANPSPAPEGTEDGTEERTLPTGSAHRRNEKLRAMIDFHIPSDTLSTAGVTESNLIQYLGLIEQKANELLTINFVVNSHKKVIQLGDVDGALIPAGGVAGLLGQGPAAPIGLLSIIAPSTA